MAEEIIFKTSVDTGSTVEDLQAIDKELKNINQDASKIGGGASEKFNTLNEKVKAGGMSVRDYSKAIREYQSIALEAGRTSPIGKEALDRASQLYDELGDLRNEVSRLGADGRALQGALQLGSTVVAGYGAVQGAMALTGIESENLQKTMVKLQAITTVLNGVEQIRIALEKESALVITAKTFATKIATGFEYIYATAIGKTTGAMKILRIAMLSLPILLIVAGIVALVGWIKSLVSENEDLEGSYDSLTKSIDKQNEALDRSQSKYLKDIDNKIKLANAQGKSQEQLHLLELERIKREEEVRKQSLNNSNKSINERLKIYKKVLKDEDEELAKKIGDEIRQEQKKNQALRDLKGQDKIDREILEAEYQKSIKEKRDSELKDSESKSKQASDSRRRAEEERRKEAEESAKKQIELERTIQDLSLAYMVDGEEKKRIQLKLSQERERAELISKFGEDQKLLNELKTKQLNETNNLELELIAEQEATKSELDLKKAEQENINNRSMLEGKLIQMREDFEIEQALKLELATLERDQLLANVNLTEGEKFKIEQEYQQKVSDLNKQAVEEEDKNNKAIIASRQALGNAVAGVFGQLAGLAKEGSKASKAFALTELAINTGIGFVNGLRIAQQGAIASGPAAPFAFPIFLATQIGAVLSAANQAKKILGSSTSVQAPQINTTGGQTNRGGTQETIQSINPINGTPTVGLQNTSTKVFVVDSEITAIQNKTQKIKAVSTIG